MRHFCTLFDQNYIEKGLALHASLMRHCVEPWTLNTLCCDADTFWLLEEMHLPNVELTPLDGFERALSLKPVRESRSWVEYLWTLASSYANYLLPQFDGITYIDADVMFFSDPKPIFEEIGQKSIGIVPHRFNEKERRRLGSNGEFNVGIVYFRNTVTGRKCLKEWAADTRAWCFNRNEAGKFGDQAYLDSFPTDYSGEVCIIENLGANLGPWSIGNFQTSFRSNEVFISEVFGRNDRLVAYHFHEYEHGVRLTNWKLREIDKLLIYQPYVDAIEDALDRIHYASGAIAFRRDKAKQESIRA